MRHHTLRAVMLPVAVVALLTGGCGSSSSSSPSSPTGSSGSSAGSGSGSTRGSAGQGDSNGEASKSPDQVLADAKNALFNARAVHVTGTMSQQGQAEQLDMHFQGQDAQGSVSVAGTAVQVVRSAGKVYLKAPAAFWAKTAGPAAGKLADKWLVVDAAQAGGASLTLQSLAASINATDSPLTPKTTTGSVGGTPTVVVSQQDGSSLQVAATGTPYPLQIANKGTGSGQITFTDYNKTMTITAPAGAVTPQQAAAAAGTPAPA